MEAMEAVEAMAEALRAWAEALLAEPRTIMAALLALLVAAVIASFLVRGGRTSKADKIAILGNCDAGKTCLFYMLRDGSLHGGTVTSMEPNEGKFPLHSELAKNPKARPVHIVDIPGHPRLRPKIDEILPQTKGIIFMIDALDIMQQLRPNAELLWDILTKATVVKRRVPLLLVCNKMDKVSAHSINFTRKMLEKEMDKLRVTRNAVSSADMASEITLGNDKEPFKFTQCVNPVSSCEVSVQEGKISEIEAFISDVVKS